jgi:integrase
MAKPNLRLVTPATENRTVTPRRAPNAALRTREHLTAGEVEKLIEAVRQNRHGHRDALMVLLAYRHGLRAAEVLTYAGGRPTSKPTPAGHSARIARFTACLRLSSGHSDEVVQGASRLPGNLNARPSPWRPQALQAYLGHRSINSTTRYAALAPGRFKNIWGRA